jgi:hypothetical protein
MVGELDMGRVGIGKKFTTDGRTSLFQGSSVAVILKLV